MSDIQPRTLSNRELLRIGADMTASGGMPVNFQVEILRRLNNYTYGVKDIDNDSARYHPDQLELDLK